jgi:6-phosphogluconolactonase/glucosamine-6-phosphate isomerase/deaminase
MDIYKPQILDFETEDYFLAKVETYLIDKIIDTNAEKGAVRLGLSFGKACSKIYKKLPQNSGIPWQRIFLYQTDEIIGKKPLQENIKELFGPDFLAEIGELNFFNLKYPPDMIVKDYVDYLENLDEVFFDITILELRPDGSFAGIFPNGSHLKDLKNPVLKVATPSNHPEKEMLTLNIESILNSDEIILLNYGIKNQSNLHELLEGQKPASQFPAKFLLAHPRLKVFQFVE